MIENADPGFDWIFGHKIKGFKMVVLIPYGIRC